MSRRDLPRLVTSLTIAATVAIVMAYVVSTDGTIIQAGGAGAATIAIFIVGVAVVVALERWLWRRSDAAQQLISVPASTRHRGRSRWQVWLTKSGVAHALGARRTSLDLLLHEGLVWLQVLKADPPHGWTAEVLRDQERSLGELQESVNNARLDPSTAASVAATLTGYVVKVRHVYEGVSASEVHRRQMGYRA